MTSPRRQTAPAAAAGVAACHAWAVLPRPRPLHTWRWRTAPAWRGRPGTPGHARTSARCRRGGRDRGGGRADGGRPRAPSSYAHRPASTTLQGGLDTPLPLPSPLDAALSTFGAFCAILAVAGLDAVFQGAGHHDLPLLVASFGASAVLLFGEQGLWVVGRKGGTGVGGWRRPPPCPRRAFATAPNPRLEPTPRPTTLPAGVPESKLSQPRNFLGGQVVSAVVGCVARLILGRVLWLSSAAGMAASLLAMQLTSTLHPPGGATALIAASAPAPLPPGAGFRFVGSVAAGAAVMQVVALAVNNLHPTVRYPSYWVVGRGGWGGCAGAGVGACVPKRRARGGG